VKDGNPCCATSRPSSGQDCVWSAVRPPLLARGDMEIGAQEMRNTEQTKVADLSAWRLRR
jgi:hypothetical protein